MASDNDIWIRHWRMTEVHWCTHHSKSSFVLPRNLWLAYISTTTSFLSLPSSLDCSICNPGPNFNSHLQSSILGGTCVKRTEISLFYVRPQRSADRLLLLSSCSPKLWIALSFEPKAASSVGSTKLALESSQTHILGFSRHSSKTWLFWFCFN